MRRTTSLAMRLMRVSPSLGFLQWLTQKARATIQMAGLFRLTLGGVTTVQGCAAGASVDLIR